MASGDTKTDDNKKKGSKGASGFLGKTGTDENPIDKTFYNILKVEPTATSSEIKRAYYALSLQYHPDRTQDLPDNLRREYAERFKTISQAYTILSDPEKRTHYNRYGKDERLMSADGPGLNLESFDAEEFFKMMFGGEQFGKIIGDFELAKSFKRAIQEILENDKEKGVEETREQKEEKMRKRIQQAEERTRAREERVKELAKNLVYKLSVYTEALPAGVDKHSEEARRVFSNFMQVSKLDLRGLLKAPYGAELCKCIGYIYKTKAVLHMNKMDSQEGHLGKRMVGFGKHFSSSWKERVHVVKETVKTVKCAVEWTQSMSKLASLADEDAAAAESSKDQPFAHHMGHLEYQGHAPSTSESTTNGSSFSDIPPSSASASSASSSTATARKPPLTASPSSKKHSHKHPEQPVVLTEEERRKLEMDTAAKSMEALWRATKLEIETVEREVCDQVLSDPTCTRETRRRRCHALMRLGELWQEPDASPQDDTDDEPSSPH